MTDRTGIHVPENRSSCASKTTPPIGHRALVKSARTVFPLLESGIEIYLRNWITQKSTNAGSNDVCWYELFPDG